MATNIQPLRGWSQGGIQNRTVLSGRGRPQDGKDADPRILLFNAVFKISNIAPTTIFLATGGSPTGTPARVVVPSR